ncbi:primosomal protein N' [Paremcibacter congregatus]|uniref:Replication restart protein PriA n=1 Tax=Paremcibacter congregatus TaxID=2043170 RepID=A0A2G4YT57_9PROT|nr:primosomal protein N' [Paremcibacter congregatus]QDE28621.1 primosomal protein N' [Paremcibacter congregatus]
MILSALFPSKRIQVLLPLPLAGPFDYLVEGDLMSGAGDLLVRRGDFVSVPLGSRVLQGVVWDIAPPETDVPAAKLKPVYDRLDLPPLPESLLKFIDWVASYSLAPLGAVLKMAVSVPRMFDKAKIKTLYRLTAALPEKLTEGRRAVVDAALGDMPMTLKDWAELAAVGEGVVRGMVKAGQMVAVEVKGDAPYPAPDLSLPAPRLSPDQQEAGDHLRGLVKAHSFGPVLLEGITGSGKTEVYFEAVAEALEKPGGQVLVLVPEIALTAQWLDRFQTRFGAEPVVWHSELTPVQRRRAWWAVAERDEKFRARVIVGARSALFLPFQDLRLIVVDEEHSPTFKQEDGVMYHGRDMAVVRAMQGQCPVVLASATPSLETLLNAQAEKYDWLYMGERHGPAVLPDMTAIDLRQHKLASGIWLSDPLRDALAENLARGEQSLLYLNRRGYAPLTLCRSCGHRMECPHCSAWLVEHKKGARLTCHHCGYNCRTPDSCPECKAEGAMVACGPGVERVAEELQDLFPEGRIALLASDEIASPAELRAVIRAIEDHEVDFIVGTQIVTKGYHFPLLTLVGVVDADLGLGGGDPRAAERTWQQLEQVAGRAGRAEHPGRVLLQSYSPEHPVLQALLSGDSQAFLEQEAHAREQQNLPPFGKLAAIIVSGADFNGVAKSARRIAALAPKDAGLTVLGPVPAPMAYLRGKNRFRLLIKADKAVRLQKIMAGWLDKCPLERGVSLQVDIDPYSFF